MHLCIADIAIFVYSIIIAMFVSRPKILMFLWRAADQSAKLAKMNDN